MMDVFYDVYGLAVVLLAVTGIGAGVMGVFDGIEARLDRVPPRDFPHAIARARRVD